MIQWALQEFWGRGSPHVHLFIWCFNVSDIQIEAAGFLKEVINVQLPYQLNYPKVFEIVKTYQVYVHSWSFW